MFSLIMYLFVLAPMFGPDAFKSGTAAARMQLGEIFSYM